MKVCVTPTCATANGAFIPRCTNKELTQWHLDRKQKKLSESKPHSSPCIQSLMEATGRGPHMGRMSVLLCQ